MLMSSDPVPTVFISIRALHYTLQIQNNAIRAIHRRLALVHPVHVAGVKTQCDFDVMGYSIGS